MIGDYDAPKVRLPGARRRARDRDAPRARCSSCCARRRGRSSSGSTSARAPASASRVVVTDLGMLEPRGDAASSTLTHVHPGRRGRARARGDRLGAARRRRPAARRGRSADGELAALRGARDERGAPADATVDPPYLLPRTTGRHRLRARPPAPTLLPAAGGAARPRARPCSARTRSTPDDADLTAAGRRRAARRADRRHAAACSTRTAGRCAARSSRSGRRTRPGATRTRATSTRRRSTRTSRGAGRDADRRRRPLPLRHGQAGRVPVAEPPRTRGGPRTSTSRSSAARSRSGS